MPTPSGGNWKEMVKAATEGDLDILKYHLETGMDPNYQHPEFMTTPLLEAARANQLESIKMLLEFNADPTAIGDFEGQSAMEEALQRKQHAIVDILLKALPKDYDNECLTIWMTGTHHRDLVTHFLDAGHCVLVTVDSEEELEAATSLLDNVKKETGNSKLWITAQSTLKEFFGNGEEGEEWRPFAVDAWLHKPNDPQKLVASVASKLQQDWKIPFRKDQGKVLFLMESMSFVSQAETQQQVAWMLEQSEMIWSSALLEPTTWWDSMTYSFWYQTWCESSLKLLVGLTTERAGGCAKGKAYNYNRQSLVLPSLDGLDNAMVKEWKIQCRL